MSQALRPNYAQFFLLPPSLDDWVAPEHPVRFVRDLVEMLDLPALGFVDREAKGDEGRPHYAVDLLLKVWLFGWMERVRTSRALEKACLRDVAFLWLTGNLHPDHNTLWRFFADNKKALRPLFKRILQVATEAGLVGYALHALDGTKMVAASSRDTAQHRERLQQQLQQIDSILDAQMAEVDKAEQQEAASYAMPSSFQDANTRRAAIRDALAKLDQADTDHLHLNEPQARMMKGRQMHTLGYNAQIVVDHDSDLIVAADVVTQENDQGQLVPMLEQVVETIGRTAEQTDADSGYCSGEQLAQAEERGSSVLVSTPQVTQTKGPFSKSHFHYDAQADVYICPQGERLVPIAKSKSHAASLHRDTIYRCDPQFCPVRSACTRSRDGRRRIRRPPFEDALMRQKHKQSHPAMGALLRLRKEIVEHIFGIIKAADGFRRFTVRGRQGAQAQWLLVCTGVNLRKLYAYWTRGCLSMAT
jgi:transposase